MAVKGLKGGHSGVEIDKGRANANLVAGRLLLALERKGIAFGIAALAGGAKQNAISRESVVRLVCAAEMKDALLACLHETMEHLQHEYAVTDPDLHMELTEKTVAGVPVLTQESARAVSLLVNNLPGGIQSMSANIKGLVETSLNMGIMELNEKELHLEFAVRSSVISARDTLTERIKQMVEYVGGSVDVIGVYPAWEYKQDSVMREDAVRIYEKMYGKEPTVEAIHAGLECGILAGKIKDLDGISIGPDMIGIHTFEEKLSIASTQRVYEYIIELLKCKHK